jgi:phosphatidylserine/phosphatidylglycerophosphate/cardiolipin synthase-like enzyme
MEKPAELGNHRPLSYKSPKEQKYITFLWDAFETNFMANSVMPTKIDTAHGIAHNKVMVVDGETVITGSFNFTKAAEESNAENLLVIRDKKLAERYVRNWKEHERHSEVDGGRGR